MRAMLSQWRNRGALVLIDVHTRFCDPRLVCPVRIVAWAAWLIALWMVLAHDGS